MREQPAKLWGGFGAFAPGDSVGIPPDPAPWNLASRGAAVGGEPQASANGERTRPSPIPMAKTVVLRGLEAFAAPPWAVPLLFSPQGIGAGRTRYPFGVSF